MEHKTKKSTHTSFAYLLLFSCGLQLTATLGCSHSGEFNEYSSRYTSSVQGQLTNDPIEDLSEIAVCKKWDIPMHAHLSNVSLAARGKKLLVTTSGSFTGLRLYSTNGKKLWQYRVKQPIRAQNISTSGKFIAASAYGDRFLVLNDRGKLLWEKPHLGKPFVFEEENLIILFNDEDSETKNAFFGYDLKGNLKFTAKSSSEAINAFLSNDKKLLFITHADNHISVFSIEGKKHGEFKIKTQPIWVASAGVTGNTIKLYILSSTLDTNAKQHLTAIEIKTNDADILNDQETTQEENKKTEYQEIWKTTLDNNDLPRRYQTVYLSKNSLILFGNFKNGQATAAYSIENGEKIWQKSQPYETLFSYPALASNEEVFIVQPAEQDGYIKVLSLNQEGKAPWSVRVPAEHGIFSYDVTEDSLVVGAGEPGAGKLYFYALNCKKKTRPNKKRR